MGEQASPVSTAIGYLSTEVKQNAQAIDGDVESLRAALKGLCDRDLMALRRPLKYGGPGLPELQFREYQEEVARYSGALAFLQTQHQSAVAMIARSENEQLKQDYLPLMGDGRKLVGIGFSQLRRHGDPIMKAEPSGGGFILNGTVPWITGYTLYEEFIIGATLPGGESLFGIVPFTEGDSIKFGEVMRLAAMESAQTVSSELKDFFLPKEKVVFERPAGWIHSNDMINIVLQGFFAVGCARAGLDILSVNAEKKHLPFLKDTLGQLSDEVDRCRKAMVSAQESSSEDVTTDEKLSARAWAIDLAVRCAHAAVASSSGAANSMQHPAQRVYREALVYTVSAQTAPVMEATLSRLAGGRS